MEAAADVDVGEERADGPDEETPSGTTNSGKSWRKRAAVNLTVDDPSLMRGMPVNCCMRYFATVLSDRPPTEQYFAMSAPVRSVDTFISHNWSTPRWQKFLVFALHFNLSIAFAIATVVAACTCGLTALGYLPRASGSFNTSQDDVDYTQAVLCLPLGLVAFVMVLVFARDIDRACLFPSVTRRHTIFLDKCCVNQIEADLKMKGIRCLAGQLFHSRDILILYSDVYTQRLWTCYELATWLMLHRGERMIVRPLSSIALVAWGLLCNIGMEVMLFVVHIYGVVEMLEPLPGIAVILLCLWLFHSIGAYISCKWAASLEAIESHAARFRLADALCAREDDRETVRGNILSFMKFTGRSEPNENDVQVFQDFEEVFRKEVPALMCSAFGYAGLPYSWAAIIGLPHALVGFDYLAGDLSHSTRFAVLEILQTWSAALLIGPETVAFSLRLARRACVRRFPGYLGAGALTAFWMGLATVCNDALTFKAVDSDAWLVLLMMVYAIHIAVTASLFRPISRTQCQS